MLVYGCDFQSSYPRASSCQGSGLRSYSVYISTFNFSEFHEAREIEVNYTDIGPTHGPHKQVVALKDNNARW